jgi:uncharacterized lipoprotein YmbA
MKRHLLLGAALACALQGCASNAPQTRFYTLDAVVPRESSAAGNSSPAPAIKVSVWQVSVPEVVDRAQMVLRSAPNRVEIADFHRWAEPLRLGIARVMADDLAARLGQGFVVTVGQPGGSPPDVRVSLDVRRFEAAPGEGVTVEALWTVMPAKGEARSGRALAQEAAGTARGQDSYSAIAAAYSRALAGISGDIAPELERLAP